MKFWLNGHVSIVVKCCRSQFREIVKRKSAENYNGTPYVVTLLSCSLWILYGLLDPDDGLLIVTVNAAGVTMQALYLTLLFFYASKEKRVKDNMFWTIKISIFWRQFVMLVKCCFQLTYFGFVVLDVVCFGVIVALTLVVFDKGSRRTFTGVLCATFTTMMYVATLAALVGWSTLCSFW